MKKIIIYILTALMMFTLLGCSKGEQWSITVDGYESLDKITTDEEVVDYAGNKSTVTYENLPSAGMQYVILNVTIKDVDSEEEFLPMNIQLTDGTNTYSRLEDNFLDAHGRERLRTYLIQFGETGGYLAFEVPANVDVNSLSVLYKTESVYIEKALK